MKGIFAVYKPKGPSSNRIITQIRKATGEKRVGHAGTLDPLAEGVLIVGVGREFTKRLGEMQKKEKEYVTEIKLGVESSTDDEEGEKKEHSVGEIPTREKVEETLKKFEGEILQTPPVYSAIKVQGKPAYRRTRKGESLELEPRKVFIRELEILDYSWPVITLRATTGSGVYVRALARDLGKELGTGGYCQSIKRTRVGEYKIEDCMTTEDFEK